MELALAAGWKQVEPRAAEFGLILSDQSPGQRLVVVDTSFAHPRDIGFSGGINCPIAVDHFGRRAFVSVDGVFSFNLDRRSKDGEAVSDDLSPVWMLAYSQERNGLLMHLHGTEPMEKYVAWLELDDGSVRKQPLPEAAFSPLDVNRTCDKVLYSTRDGVAIYDVSEELTTLASAPLKFQAMGGAFDVDERKVILGGYGLHSWNTETGKTSRLCSEGSYPVVARDESIWFSLQDGAVARLGDAPGEFDIMVELSGVDTSGGRAGSYAQPVTFSPDGRYCFATLTGRTELSGSALEEAEAFCKRVGQPLTEDFQYAFHHYYCILDLGTREAWCRDGYAHNAAWYSV